MRPKSIFTIVTALFLIFVSLGDRILPKPLSDASRNTRNGINNAIIGIFPQKQFKNPNERTEKAVDQLEKK
jgi:hypothetical protein